MIQVDVYQRIKSALELVQAGETAEAFSLAMESLGQDLAKEADLKGLERVHDLLWGPEAYQVVDSEYRFHNRKKFVPLLGEYMILKGSFICRNTKGISFGFNSKDGEYYNVWNSHPVIVWFQKNTDMVASSVRGSEDIFTDIDVQFTKEVLEKLAEIFE